MESQPLVYLNGEYLDYDMATLPVEERASNFGDAVYEVVHYYNGEPFRMDRHMARLVRSADGVMLPLPPLDKLQADMNELVRRQGLGDASIYLQISRGSGPRQHVLPRDPKLNVLAIARPAPTVRPRKSYTAITVSDDRWARCYIKTVMLLPNTLAREQAIRRGAYDAIFVRDGFVMEATASNIFCVFDGKLHTPPLTNYILAGVTREVVLELADSEAIMVIQEPIPASKIYGASEVFLSGTLSEVSALTAIDGQTIGKGEPGPIFKKIAHAFDRLIGIEA